MGASLAATGTTFQAIFKNPLVDSNILGVTSGAGFGASLALLLLESNVHVQISAFLFGLVAVTFNFLWKSFIQNNTHLCTDTDGDSYRIVV